MAFEVFSFFLLEFYVCHEFIRETLLQHSVIWFDMVVLTECKYFVVL